MPFGATDCSLPAKYARRHSLDVDAILIYTDMETGSARDSGHPTEHLNKLREESGRDVKQAVIATESNGFSIANPNDPDQLDVVGFSTRTPKLLGWFLSQ